MKRLSSSISFYFKYIYQFIASFWTLVFLLLLLNINDFNPGLLIFILFIIIILWVFIYFSEPWKNGHLYIDETKFEFELNGYGTIINFEDVLRITQNGPLKFSSVKIRFRDGEGVSEIKFIPRQLRVIFLFPFCNHPIIEELNEVIQNRH